MTSALGIVSFPKFAIHGGTTINLFHKNMPRYSIDIDITYIPIEDRTTSLRNINQKLLEMKRSIERSISGIVVRGISLMFGSCCVPLERPL